MNDTQTLTAGLAFVVPLSLLLLSYFVNSRLIDQIDKRIDVQAAALNQRIDSQTAALKQRIDDLDSRFEIQVRALDQRITDLKDLMAARFDRVEELLLVA